MACCVALSGISRDCDANVGGIRRAWIACWGEVTATTVTSNEISAITPASAFHLYEFRKQTGNFSIAINRNDTNGTLYYETTITFVFSKMETVKRLEVAALAASDLAIIVEDNNGVYWYFGYDNYVVMGDSTGDTGTAFEDVNGWTLTFTDVSSVHPMTITNGAMAPILGLDE